MNKITPALMMRLRVSLASLPLLLSTGLTLANLSVQKSLPLALEPPAEMRELEEIMRSLGSYMCSAKPNFAILRNARKRRLKPEYLLSDEKNPGEFAVELVLYTDDGIARTQRHHDYSVLTETNQRLKTLHQAIANGESDAQQSLHWFNGWVTPLRIKLTIVSNMVEWTRYILLHEEGRRCSCLYSLRPLALSFPSPWDIEVTLEEVVLTTVQRFECGRKQKVLKNLTKKGDWSLRIRSRGGRTMLRVVTLGGDGSTMVDGVREILELRKPDWDPRSAGDSARLKLVCKCMVLKFPCAIFRFRETGNTFLLIVADGSRDKAEEKRAQSRDKSTRSWNASELVPRLVEKRSKKHMVQGQE
ncbi:hypothetical protein C8J56DRAFT_1027748, partial [Mycena floridula]